MGVFGSRPESVLRGLPSNADIEALEYHDGLSREDATAARALYYLNDQLNLIKHVMSETGRQAEYSYILGFLETRRQALEVQSKHIVWGEARVIRDVRAARRVQDLD